MEAEERPSKMRKLSHSDSASAEPAEAAFQNGNDSDNIGADGSTHAKDGEHDSRIEDEAERDTLLHDVSKRDVSEGSESENDLNDQLPPPGETAPLAGSGGLESNDPPISKNQLKKLRRKQEWESKREQRKAIRKEKIVAKRERKRAARHQAAAENDGAEAKPAPTNKLVAQSAVQLPVTFLIDCDFDELMRDNERISLAAQITRSYSDNKNSMFRAHLTICSFRGHLRERFDNVLTHYKQWRGVRFVECDFVQVAEKAKEWMLDLKHGGRLAGSFSHWSNLPEDEQAKLKEEGEVVYLSSESDETLTELKPYSTYIIGGLVDKNREKGICYKRAMQRGVKTARLPIGEFMEMQSRKVLATNHVNEIMLKWLECGNWGEAFMKAIPKRKGGRLKGESDEAKEVRAAVDGSCVVDVLETDVSDAKAAGKAN